MLTYYLGGRRTHNLRAAISDDDTLEAFFRKKTLVEFQAKNESINDDHFCKSVFLYHHVTDEECLDE